MRIVIPGGSGQVGQMLSRAFLREGHEVTILSRGNLSSSGAQSVSWDGENLGPWTRALEGSDILINLAGRSVNCRYSQAHRREIVDSRVLSTRVLAQAVRALRQPPRVWLQASTATLYAHTFGTPHDENTGVIGGSEPRVPETWRFSIEVATAWEKAFDDAPLGPVRKIKLRSAMTMSPDLGGVFDTLATLARRGLGGAAGDGRQYVSWIHEHDFIRAVSWLAGREDLSGPFNLSSPHPLPNAEFMRVLRRALDARFGLPAAPWMLEVGAFFMRTETELILKSRRVIPSRLLESGFSFHFPAWPEACAELAARWR